MLCHAGSHQGSPLDVQHHQHEALEGLAVGDATPQGVDLGPRAAVGDASPLGAVLEPSANKLKRSSLADGGASPLGDRLVPSSYAEALQ